MAVNHFFIDPSFGQYIIGPSIKHVDRFFDVEKDRSIAIGADSNHCGFSWIFWDSPLTPPSFSIHIVYGYPLGGQSMSAF